MIFSQLLERVKISRKQDDFVINYCNHYNKKWIKIALSSVSEVIINYVFKMNVNINKIIFTT